MIRSKRKTNSLESILRKFVLEPNPALNFVASIAASAQAHDPQNSIPPQLIELSIKRLLPSLGQTENHEQQTNSAIAISALNALGERRTPPKTATQITAELKKVLERTHVDYFVQANICKVTGASSRHDTRLCVSLLQELPLNLDKAVTLKMRGLKRGEALDLCVEDLSAEEPSVMFSKKVESKEQDQKFVFDLGSKNLDDLYLMLSADSFPIARSKLSALSLA